MKPEKNIKRSIKNAKVKINQDVKKTALAKLVNELEKPQKTSPADTSPNIRRIIMKTKTTKLAAAAAIIIAALITVNIFDSKRNTLFAQVSDQIKNAKTITWEITFYTRVTGKDDQSTWIETKTRQMAYKTPGLYREVKFDKDMKIRSVTITDTQDMTELTLIPKEKKAILSGLALTNYDSQGPFSWEKKYIKEENLEWTAKQKTETGEVNIFRSSFWDKANNEDWSYDFWVDAETKKLVTVQVPGSDIYNPENDLACNNPPERAWQTKEPICHVKHNIKIDAELDESLFQMQPPQDYEVTYKDRLQVTEEDMINYLDLLAQYYNDSFPSQLFPFDVPSDEINVIEDKVKGDRTAIEQELLETKNYYKSIGLNMMPVAHFVEDHTIANSFKYMGKEVKLGDKNRIVCWYKLKGSNTYRAVYGDLSVKDVEPEDLPLSVEP